MPVTANARKAYRADAKSNHTLLSEQERARLIQVRRLDVIANVGANGAGPFASYQR